MISNEKKLEYKEIWKKNLNSLKNKEQDLLKKIETFKSKGKGTIEPTSSGLLTLKIKDSTGEYYFHSNGNLQIEGNDFAKNHYLIFGLGLGYHIKAFLDIDDGLYIDIIEPDLNIIKIANQYIDLDWLYNNPSINLIYDDTYQKLNQLLLKKNLEFIIHYPSLRHIENENIKLTMEKIFIRDSGIRNFKIQFENNFRENILNYDEYVDVLKLKFEERNTIIVPAGPSLDKNIEMLLKNLKETIILVVGIVFKKLIRLGITPDYVIFLDVQPSLYEQVVGLENLDIPIIFASTACKTIGRNYKGKIFNLSEGFCSRRRVCKKMAISCMKQVAV